MALPTGPSHHDQQYENTYGPQGMTGQHPTGGPAGYIVSQLALELATARERALLWRTWLHPDPARDEAIPPYLPPEQWPAWAGRAGVIRMLRRAYQRPESGRVMVLWVVQFRAFPAPSRSGAPALGIGAAAPGCTRMFAGGELVYCYGQDGGQPGGILG